MSATPRSPNFLPLLCTILLLSACGGGDNGPPPPSSSPPPPPTPVLAGAGATSALAALTAKTARSADAADESHGYLLNRLIVILQAGASVDQVNAAARSVGASHILASRTHFPVLTLEVARQADVAALRALATTLRAQPGVVDAFAARLLAPSMLPTLGTNQPVASLSHLFASRFPQAWNAHGAAGANCSRLGRPVPVYVADRFGPSEAALEAFASEGAVLSGPTGNDPDGYHGMRVSLAIAGDFDASAPTGATPFAHCVQIHAVNSDLTDVVSAAFELLGSITPEINHFIVNMSLNFDDPAACGAAAGAVCTSANAQSLDPAKVRDEILERAVFARSMIQALSLNGPLDGMLVTVSAGNVAEPGVEGSGLLAQRYPGFRDARFSNPFSLATHFGEIDTLLRNAALWADADPAAANVTFDTATLSRLHADLQAIGTTELDPGQVIVVDSGKVAESADGVAPSLFDFLGADLRAVGEPVKLMGVDNPPDLSQAQFAGVGTSLAAPQVAGLAAYLWSLSPDLGNLPPVRTKQLILGTAHAHAGAGLAAVPLLDAYAATLALDLPNVDLDVRRALLDANGDGAFDALDLQQFASAYDLANPNRVSIPTARDFGRFDLNGDGYTGGIPIAAFDLDAGAPDVNGRPTINSTDLSIEGYPVTFNEAALSDLQILCYYAYSPLYRSDGGGQNDQLRTSLLGPHVCIGARLDLQLPGSISAATPLNVSVQVPAGQGQLAPAPDVLVELTPTCATVNPASGRTDANGNLSTVVTPDAGCTTASVQAVARADANTPPLATEVTTVSVTAPSPNTFAIVDIDQGSGQPGTLRATFITDANVTWLQFTLPVSDLQSFMDRFNQALEGVTEIGNLGVFLTDTSLPPIRIDAPNTLVSDLGINSSCGSTVNVTVGDLRPNLAGTQSTRGAASVGGCGTVHLTTGRMVALVVVGNNLDLTASATAVSSGVNVGAGTQGAVSSKLDLTIGSTHIISIANSIDTSVGIHGSADADLAVINNRNLTLTTDLDAPSLIRDLLIRNTTFVGPSLDRFKVGSARNVEITGNTGFSDTDARNFAATLAISGTTTIGNNRAP